MAIPGWSVNKERRLDNSETTQRRCNNNKKQLSKKRSATNPEKTNVIENKLQRNKGDIGTTERELKTGSTTGHIKTASKRSGNKGREFIIATLNVQTLRTEEREEELERALRETKIDILGICEVRKLGEAITERENGDLFHYKGETAGHKGVGFIIKKDIKHMVQDIVGITERIAVLKLDMKYCTITIIQTYAPTEASSDEELENFYNDLEQALNQHRSQKNFINRDMNSKVGTRNHEDEESVGPHGIGIRNKRGERLIQFAQEYKMKVANTFFRKPPQSKWTWRSPNGKTKNEIDFILCERIEDVRDVQVLNGLKFSTDHRMVKARINVQKRRRYNVKPRVVNINQLDNEDLQHRLQEQLTQAKFDKEKGTQELYDTLEKCINQASRDAEKKTRDMKNTEKLSKDTRELIERRMKLQQARDLSEHNRLEYLKLDKIVKREIRKDIRKYRSEQTKQIIESSKTIRKAKGNLNKGKKWMLATKSSEGKNITSRKNINNIVTDYYRDLYTSTVPSIPKIQVPNVTNVQVPRI